MKQEKQAVTELISTCLEQLPGGVIISREEPLGELVYINQYVVDFFDCRSKEEVYRLAKHNLLGLVPQEERETLRKIMYADRQCTAAPLHMRYTLGTRTGRLRHVDVLDYIVEMDAGERLHYLFSVPGDDPVLTQDALSGKRRFLTYTRQIPQLEAARQSIPDLAILSFHIDHYKMYAMKYGSEATEKMVLRCAALVQEIFAHTFLFSLSEERFVFLAHEDALEEKICQAQARMRSEFPDQIVMFHFGIYRLHEPGEDLNRAITWAELACDNIRDEVSACYEECTAPLREEIQIRRHVVSHIDEAIEKGWIRPYYQPVAWAGDLTLHGFEALARWQDPHYGMLLPDTFIKALEDSHQIDKLDQYTITCICREYRQRVDLDLPVFPISLNLSRLDFFLSDAFQVLEDNVSCYDVPRELIRIEITESLMIGDAGRMEEEISRFRDAGYQVWMDDFGSGYSSLHTLKSYTFDMIKLDKEFIRPFTDKGRRIVTSILAMNHVLAVPTLVEGVETWDQLAFLRKRGCELIQGYLLGAPMPYEKSLENFKRIQQRLHDGNT